MGRSLILPTRRPPCALRRYGGKVKTLTKKMLRDITSQKYIFAALVILIAFGISMYSGFILSYESLSVSYDTTYENLSLQDFSVDLFPLPKEAVTLNEKGIKDMELRYILDTSLYISDYQQVRLRIIAMSDDPTVNKVKLEEGTSFQKGECLVDKHLSDFYKFTVGDTLQPIIEGKKVPMKISGIVTSPEYLIPSASEQDIIPSPGSFGVIFVSKEYMQELLGQSMVNNICFIVEKGYDREQVIQHVENTLGKSVYQVTRKEDVPSHKALKLDLEGFREMAYFFPLVVLIIAALSLFTIISRLIEAQRREIGVLKAIGVSKYRILSNYLMFSLLTGVLGIFLGVFLGWLLTSGFTSFYASELGIPYVKVVFFWRPIYEAAAASLVVCFLSGFIPARRSLGLQPAQALRDEPTVSEGRQLNLPFKIKTATLLPFRNITRKPRRTIFTMIGLTFSIMIIIMSFGFSDSMDYIMEEQYGKVYTWDMRVELNTYLSVEDLQQFTEVDGVTVVEPFVFFPARVNHKNEEEFLPVLAIKPDTEMYDFAPVALEEGKAYLSLPKKSRIDWNENDELLIETYAGNASLEMGGFVKEYMGGYVYITYQDVEKFGVHGFNGVLLKGESLQETKKGLYSIPNVAKVEVMSETVASFRELLKLFNAFVGLMLGISLVIAAALTFNTVTINVVERRREIATLRTLGMKSSEVIWSTTFENIVVFLLSVVPGIILGYIVLDYGISLFTMDLFFLEAHVYLKSFLTTLVCMFLTVMVAQLPSLRYMLRLDLAKITKERVT
jgi:putative ABC transport system permease protein